MSDNETRLSVTEIAQTNANLRLASEFVQEMLDEPERFEAIPEGATVVLLPPDDPGDTELSKANIRMAKIFAGRGRHVVLWAVDMPPASAPQILVRWPAVRNDQPVSVTYDRRQDTLRIALSDSERPTMPVRVNPHVVFLVDPEAKTLAEITVPQFLAVAAPKSLALFDLLLLPTTRLIGITPNEVHAIRNSLVHDRPLPDRKEVTWRDIADEFAALTA